MPPVPEIESPELDVIAAPTFAHAGKPGTAARHPIATILGVAVFVLSSLFLLHVVDRHIPAAETDLMPRWIGTQAALHGENPYSAEVLQRIQTTIYGHPLRKDEHIDPQLFLYPAPIILFIAPLTLLSWRAAGFVVLLAICPLLVWSFWLSIRSLRLSLTAPQTAFTLTVAFFSWPVMWGLRCQQPALVVAILLFVAWFLLARGHQILPGTLLAVAMVKPQLVLPWLLWLIVWAAMRQSWRFLASLVGTLAVMWYATDRIVPHWFPLWRDSLRNYTSDTHTALPLVGWFGHWGGLFLTLALTAGCAVMLFRLLRCAPDSPEFGIAASLALAGTLNVVPDHVSLIYNNVLLFPACLLLVFARPVNRWAALTRCAALAVLICDLASVVVAAIGTFFATGASGWTALPFLDDLLAAVLALFLIVNAWDPIRRSALPSRTLLEPVSA